jgi:hypothetical protein
VHRLEREGLEHQHLEGALQHVDVPVGHRNTPLDSLKDKMDASFRLSRGARAAGPAVDRTHAPRPPEGRGVWGGASPTRSGRLTPRLSDTTAHAGATLPRTVRRGRQRYGHRRCGMDLADLAAEFAWRTCARFEPPRGRSPTAMELLRIPARADWTADLTALAMPRAAGKAQLVREFLRTARPDALDTGCAARVSRRSRRRRERPCITRISRLSRATTWPAATPSGVQPRASRSHNLEPKASSRCPAPGHSRRLRGRFPDSAPFPEPTPPMLKTSAAPGMVLALLCSDIPSANIIKRGAR